MGKLEFRIIGNSDDVSIAMCRCTDISMKGKHYHKANRFILE